MLNSNKKSINKKCLYLKLYQKISVFQKPNDSILQTFRKALRKRSVRINASKAHKFTKYKIIKIKQLELKKLKLITLTDSFVLLSKKIPLLQNDINPLLHNLFNECAILWQLCYQSITKRFQCQQF